MASIVDVDNTPGNLEELESSLKEAVVAAAPKPEETQETPVVEEPKNVDPLEGTKFEGKDLGDILDSYKNLESLYGRMANDLGTQRKLTDRLLDLKRDTDLESNAPEPYKVKAAELLDDPTKTLDAMYADREARSRKDIDDRLAQMESQMQSDRFMQKHPDFMTVGQSEEFRTWAQATPVRNSAAQRAANGDWDAADALLEEYKTQVPAVKKDAQETTVVQSEAELETARQVALETSAQGGGAETNTGKIYRRADLIDLKIRKPAVYGDPAFQAEILKAYSEGRVK